MKFESFCDNDKSSWYLRYGAKYQHSHIINSIPKSDESVKDCAPLARKIIYYVIKKIRFEKKKITELF